GNAFARCLAAHYLADTESDPQKALEWDLKALEIAQSVPLEEEHPSDPTAAAVKTFYPSLYLSVADGYRKVGDFTSARRHVKEGTAWSAVLGLDAYGQRVRAELLRVAAQIDESDSGPSVVFDYD
ncbi:MAG TPA: hypothetical protein VHJ78_12690, partial [Actinomycetota bacterium]|nr:hypothetical protein [Actinomycetota bacterium]